MKYINCNIEKREFFCKVVVQQTPENLNDNFESILLILLFFFFLGLE